MRDDRIDFLRGIAIFAVVLDHSFGWAYKNVVFHELTTFSVTLFVLCGGFTSYINMRNKRFEEYNFESRVIFQWYRAWKVILPYSIATAFCTYVDNGYYWDYLYWKEKLLQFNGAPPFYYLVFYLQLLFISTVLYKTIVQIQRENDKKLLIIREMFLLLIIIVIAYICTEKTVFQDVYGGGRYLFGGSYLIIFTLGMILASHSTINKRKWGYSTKVALLSFVALYSCLIGRVGLVNIVEPYSKWIGNPPGIVHSIWALLIVCVVYVCTPLLYKSPLSKLSKIICVCGRYSYYIFLYHFYLLIILRNTVFMKFPLIERMLALRFLFIFIYGIGVPVTAEIVIIKFKKCVLGSKG